METYSLNIQIKLFDWIDLRFVFDNRHYKYSLNFSLIWMELLVSNVEDSKQTQNNTQNRNGHFWWRSINYRRWKLSVQLRCITVRRRSRSQLVKSENETPFLKLHFSFFELLRSIVSAICQCVRLSKENYLFTWFLLLLVSQNLYLKLTAPLNYI